MTENKRVSTMSKKKFGDLIKENASAGATGAGAVASAPASMGKPSMRKRPSIFIGGGQPAKESKITEAASKFVLEIELGNAAMRNYLAVSDALRRVSDQIRLGEKGRKIMDTNGNSVGFWEFK